DQFLNRKIIKKYLALVEGIPKDKEGVINFQIRPSTQNRLKKVAIKKLDTSGKKSVRAAETYYKIKKIINDNLALLEVTPKTGRTHQIRVHLAAIGHPVAGDSLYGSKSNWANRQMLHAYYLKFIAPSGKKLALKIRLPKDFNKYGKKRE
ncbi:MAG: RluA family pseudouridine synthase, partial [bacterium]|nr:RluA family pseudouridine synthase [bacterium]